MKCIGQKNAIPLFGNLATDKLKMAKVRFFFIFKFNTINFR